MGFAVIVPIALAGMHTVDRYYHGYSSEDGPLEGDANCQKDGWNQGDYPYYDVAWHGHKDSWCY